MKILALLLLVAVAAAVNSYEGQEANVYYEQLLEVEESGRSHLNIFQFGTIGPDDRLISDTTHEAYGIEYHVNDHELTYRGSENTNITGIIVHEYLSNYTAVTIQDGGIHRNYVTISLKGRRSYHVGCRIGIFASINCSNM
ncbi:uncharacterized protein LOC118277184 [Spodoptera frugiperda]|uniref:Uncharacterized protein LOC118277184 n=1 Tax=Spodoptera frugiperda TaxID=7108 RepID=A0A9R0DGC1_SPOFR|nr:uncharacterized protein LOC118277184 [Spodoptera frugiperda]